MEKFISHVLDANRAQTKMENGDILSEPVWRFIGWKESSDHSYKRKRRYVVGDANYCGACKKYATQITRSENWV